MWAHSIGAPIAQPTAMNASRRRFVYLLRSLDGSDRPYVGLTSDVAARLGFHNAGLSPHTAKYRPWELVVAQQSSFQTNRAP